MPKVYNKHHKDAPPNAIYVGRPTKWGNPFKIGDESYYPGTPMTRQDAVDHFRASVTPEMETEIRQQLRGRDLVCWCAPKPCHADILLEIANDETTPK